MKMTKESSKTITYDKNEIDRRRIIYTIHHEEQDITFIFEDIMIKETEKTVSTELKGFYYGRPNILDTERFYGKLKAEF